MVFAFDSLSFAKHLRDNGVPQGQAEAHAEAARQFIMAELVTRNDLDAAVGAVRSEMAVTRHDLETSISAVRQDVEVLRRELESRMDTLSLRLTVRLGGLIAVGVAVLAAIIKL